MIEPWEHGTVVRATRIPDLLGLQRRAGRGRRGDRRRRAGRGRGRGARGLAHRRVGSRSRPAGEPCAPSWRRSAGRSRGFVWMLHDGAARRPRPGWTSSRSRTTSCGTSGSPGTARTSRAWTSRTTSRRRGRSRCIGTPRCSRRSSRTGRLGSRSSSGRAPGAEISSVYVDREQRGRGLGTALTKAAIAAAGEVSDLWIVADDEDRPKELYARLGFQPGVEAARLPAPAAAERLAARRAAGGCRRPSGSPPGSPRRPACRGSPPPAPGRFARRRTTAPSRARVDLLVGHEGRHVDEVARARLGQVLEPLAPAHPRPAADHVDHRTRARRGGADRSWRPGGSRPCPPTASRRPPERVDRALAVHAGRLRRIRVELVRVNHADAVGRQSTARLSRHASRGARPPPRAPPPRRPRSSRRRPRRAPRPRRPRTRPSRRAPRRPPWRR